MNKVVILGTAHGINVAGKRDPEGKFREYAYSRELILLEKPILETMGYLVFVDMPEAVVPLPLKIELQKRCDIVNAICKKYGKNNCVYVSEHNDAAGSGKYWMNAGGWSCFTTKGRTKSDDLAECLYNAAELYLKPYVQIMAEGKKKGIYSVKQVPFRMDKTDGDKDKEENYYVLKNTVCPAVLTENLFQDNKSDVAYLTSIEGKKAIVDLHVHGIHRYFQSL